MKILCMLESGMESMNKPILERAAYAFPHAEICTGVWAKEGVDLAEVIRQIEVHGPDSEEIPPAFYEHKDAEILIGSFCPFSKKGLAVFNNLKVLGVVRAGMENVNVEAAKAMGIAVVNATGRNADSVSDFAVGLLLAECRNIARSHDSIKHGGFRRQYSNSASMPDLRGKTVGLVGFGFIGRLVAEKLSGFHVNTIVYDPYVKLEDAGPYHVKLVDKKTLFSQADFISVHARYAKDTHHIIGKAEFALMKPTAYFINTARAGLVDYDAMYQALAEKRIAGAGLDVYENEPLETDNPLLTLDNVTLTSHIAGGTVDAANNSPRLVFERVINVIKGRETDGMLNPEILVDEGFLRWTQEAANELL